ncbi:MAG: adenine nucleotide alpha hydrolase [Acidimicrobiia bacterium]|nr:adenine nucleotide alpha hydrolase [Acidimicrobiia bacterium]
MTAKSWMSWSSGKDSTLALHVARHELNLDVSALLVTVNAEADRVAMHAVRRSLLSAQSERVGIPLHVVEIPSPCPNDVYDARMGTAMAEAKADGVDRVIFGDLFLADIRAYRENALAGSGIDPVFPLWERPTDALARDMLAAGIRAVLTCVDPKQLAPEFAGRQFDEALLADLPPSVDPCGENGEFHTFVYDGPGFASAIDIEVGEVVERGGFVFCDVRPG